MRFHRGGIAARSLWCGCFAVWLGAVTPACNWTTFSDDANKAPVRSIGAPSSFKAQDFGQSVLPLSDGQGKAAAFVVTSVSDADKMVVVTINADGTFAAPSVDSANLRDTESSNITTLAEVPGTSPTRLLLATPEVHLAGHGRIYSYLLSATLDGTANNLVVTSLPEKEPGLGRGLAAGFLGGVEGTPDFVVASNDHLVVLVDGLPENATIPGTGAGCDLTIDPAQDARYRLRRSLVTARLWADPAGAAVQQLVAGATHSGTPGKLSLFSVSGGGAASNLNCLATVTAPAPKNSSRFGASLATGDFNADGIVDLLVGAPGQEAFVYFGPFPVGGFPAAFPIMDSDGVDFGFAVAALNVDGIAGDEAIIGDPLATVDGQEKAGRVTAYSWDAATMSMKPGKTYADHSPAKDANFGWTVNALKFCVDASLPAPGTACTTTGSSRILMVGAKSEVFVYFREGQNIPTRDRDGAMVLDVRAP